MFDCAVQLLKVNESARLSARDSMAAHVVIVSTAFVMEAASRFEATHQSLLEPSILDVLEYACEHDFTYLHKSLAAQAAVAGAEVLGAG